MNSSWYLINSIAIVSHLNNDIFLIMDRFKKIHWIYLHGVKDDKYHCTQERNEKNGKKYGVLFQIW